MYNRRYTAYSNSSQNSNFYCIGEKVKSDNGKYAKVLFADFAVYKHPKMPNQETLQALRDARERKNLIMCKSIKELFANCRK